MSKYTNEIEKRRTFAIISHPDAGKTTLTEKFLLYGGAINLAGSVKGKATARHAVSDWMEIEKERGISVTSSVLQFHYDGYCISSYFVLRCDNFQFGLCGIFNSCYCISYFYNVFFGGGTEVLADDSNFRVFCSGAWADGANNRSVVYVSKS